MNILIFTKTFPETKEDWRGIYVREQAEALASEHTVTVVKCKYDNNDFNPFFKFRIETTQCHPFKYFTITVSKSFSVYNQFNYIVTLYFALKKIIRQNRPEIIHCHFTYPPGVVAWLIKLRTGIPYIITEHTRLSKTFRSIFHKKLSLIALRNANSVIAVSTFFKKEILAEKVHTVTVIPNTIDVNRFHTAVKKSDPFIIGFLGALYDQNKGLDILLSACSDLPFNFLLKIGGPGSLHEFFKDNSLREKLEGKIIRVEYIDKLLVNQFYSDINLLALPSHYETFGLVLIEAMAAGIPVVATKSGGPEDIVNENTGILTDIGDPLSMREAIIKIHSDYYKYDSEDIRRYVILKFGFETFLKSINIIYQSCLSK
jgi:glycosyltransferase involved in cell wall biosynthesis